jgi:hypothetical protein
VRARGWGHERAGAICTCILRACLYNVLVHTFNIDLLVCVCVCACVCVHVCVCVYV